MGLFTPQRYVAEVAVVDLAALRARGKRALLLDRDNTIVPRDTKQVPPATVGWLARAHELGFKLCFVSNNWACNVRPDADRFGAQLVSRAAKPLPFALWHACSKLGVSRREAVLLGDQVFTDLLGGKLAGIDTVLVQPQTEVDLAHTLLLRKVEARVLGDIRPEVRACAAGASGGGAAPGDASSPGCR